MTCINYHELMKNELGEQRYHQLIEEAHRIYRHQHASIRTIYQPSMERITLEDFTERYILEKVRSRK